jgi:hypothetical protein
MSKVLSVKGLHTARSCSRDPKTLRREHGMEILEDLSVSVSPLLWGAGPDLLSLVLAYRLFVHVCPYAVRTGLIARYSTENPQRGGCCVTAKLRYASSKS